MSKGQIRLVGFLSSRPRLGTTLYEQRPDPVGRFSIVATSTLDGLHVRERDWLIQLKSVRRCHEFWR